MYLTEILLRDKDPTFGKNYHRFTFNDKITQTSLFKKKTLMFDCDSVCLVFYHEREESEYRCSENSPSTSFSGQNRGRSSGPRAPTNMCSR